mgnify:FL=1
MLNHELTPLHRSWLPGVCVALWLLCMVFAFWWFEYRHWQTFNEQNVIFNGAELSLLQQRLIQKNQPQNMGLQVVHFTDDACQCSRYSQSHIKRLQPVFESVTQITLSPKHPSMQGISIPASPSVAIWDEHGELAYFGPYSSGAICGEGNDFVKPVINQLKQQSNPRWVNMIGIGCYCPWKEGKHNA